MKDALLAVSLGNNVQYVISADQVKRVIRY
jgi:hypothetical protein